MFYTTIFLNSLDISTAIAIQRHSFQLSDNNIELYIDNIMDNSMVNHVSKAR